MGPSAAGPGTAPAAFGMGRFDALETPARNGDELMRLAHASGARRGQGAFACSQASGAIPKAGKAEIAEAM